MPRQTSIKVTPDQADVLRRFALDVSARVGRRLSLGSAMVAAVTVATNHAAEATRTAAELVPDGAE